jgi:hypothetical protein
MRQSLFWWGGGVLEYGVSTFHLLIDFKAAYDATNREKLLQAMKELTIHQKLTGLARANLEHVKCSVKVQNNLLEPSRT